MKRWLARICVLLVIGAIINIAVAWGFALSLNLDASKTASRARGLSDPGAGFWFITRVSTTGALQIRSLWPNTVSSTTPIPLADKVAGSWAAVFRSPKYVGEAVTVDVRGWPVLSMFSIAHRHDVWNHAKGSADLHYDVDSGIAVHDWPIPAGYGGIRLLRVLPLRPHWPGFAINTAFYTAILCGIWLLLAIPFALRNWRRKKRGLCPKCAYPIGTNERCTECGLTLPLSHGDESR